MAFSEARLKHLYVLADTIDLAFREATLDCRAVRGLAAYLYVDEVQPDAGGPSHP